MLRIVSLSQTQLKWIWHKTPCILQIVSTELVLGLYFLSKFLTFMLMLQVLATAGSVLCQTHTDKQVTCHTLLPFSRCGGWSINISPFNTSPSSSCCKHVILPVDKHGNLGAVLPFFCHLAGVVAELTTSAPWQVAATVGVSLHQVGLMKVNNIMAISPFCCLAGITSESASPAPRQVVATTA